MRLNWLGYTYSDYVGYGKYSNRMVMALRKAGIAVRPELAGAAYHPDWLLAERGMDWDCPTISCMPPYHLCKLPQGAGPHWLLTMTEGGELPKDWADTINKSGIERVIVPCEHNAKVFRDGGVNAPVTVISGGTDPDEFPLVSTRRPNRPYTFLALADRGYRKGWMEVYKAFYVAFGGKTEGEQACPERSRPERYGGDGGNVRLIIKCRPDGNELIETITRTGIIDADPRITYLVSDAANLRDLFEQVDCFAIPSRTEGWGMPHREAAMMGLPVITQRHSGLDDGHTHEWAIVLENGHMQQIDDEGKHIAGEWMVADIDELAAVMRACYDEPQAWRRAAKFAREWLKGNQTWAHAATALLTLMEDEGVLEPERVPVEVMAWPI